MRQLRVLVLIVYPVCKSPPECHRRRRPVCVVLGGGVCFWRTFQCCTTQRGGKRQGVGSNSTGRNPGDGMPQSRGRRLGVESCTPPPLCGYRDARVIPAHKARERERESEQPGKREASTREGTKRRLAGGPPARCTRLCSVASQPNHSCLYSGTERPQGSSLPERLRGACPGRLSASLHGTAWNVFPVRAPKKTKLKMPDMHTDLFEALHGRRREGEARHLMTV